MDEIDNFMQHVVSDEVIVVNMNIKEYWFGVVVDWYIVVVGVVVVDMIYMHTPVRCIVGVESQEFVDSMGHVGSKTQ